MKKLAAVILFVAFVAGATLVCARQTSSRGLAPPPNSVAQQVPAEKRNWVLTISTTGGFTGRGNGSITADAAGNIQTGARFPPDCSAKLAAAELQPLASAVAESRPDSWTTSYTHPKNPSGCCDQFGYTLTLEFDSPQRTRSSHRTFWFDETSSKLPDDLRRVFDAAWAIKSKAAGACDRKT
jgi:hypothetical protein